MTRGVCWFLVGSLVLVMLAGCGRNWIAQREAWRHEAEVACLKSGAVKEGPAVVRIEPIEGPGVCGADFPLKVSALGESNALAYVGAPRPPAAIPNAAAPSWPIAQPRSAMPAPTYNPPQIYNSDSPGAPLSLTPPGLPQSNDIATAATEPPDRGPPNRFVPPAALPSSPPPALGPVRAPQYTGALAAAAVNPPATLACPLVSALDQWITGAVQPAAMRWFGQRVVAIKQISAYSCRGMNGNPHAHISEHAFGNALDIAAFTLADGRKVTVKTGWHGLPEEQGFLRDVQGAACAQFTTVLAPGSNRYHYDHFHVDLMRRASGRQVCKPQAVPGEVVAARVRARLAKQRYDPGVTGAINPPTERNDRAGSEDRDADAYDDHLSFGWRSNTPARAPAGALPGADW